VGLHFDGSGISTSSTRAAKSWGIEMSTGLVIESAVSDVYAFEYEGDMLAYGGKPGSKIDLVVNPE